MSTYLLAWVIGEFSVVEAVVKASDLVAAAADTGAADGNGKQGSSAATTTQGFAASGDDVMGRGGDGSSNSEGATGKAPSAAAAARPRLRDVPVRVFTPKGRAKQACCRTPRPAIMLILCAITPLLCIAPLPFIRANR
jgi:hypothetical protein